MHTLACAQTCRLCKRSRVHSVYVRYVHVDNWSEVITDEFYNCTRNPSFNRNYLLTTTHFNDNYLGTIKDTTYYYLQYYSQVWLKATAV